jgi:broad specificity phosphatase PhoE
MDIQQSAIAFLVDPPSLADLNGLLMREWFPIVLTVAMLLFLVSRLRTKHFYFVRHGETILNEAEVRQGEAGSLNEAGKMQADMAGLYLTQFHIQEICSSTFERAKETAEAISERNKNTPVIFSPLLAERRNPSSVVGRSFHDPEVAHMTDLIDKSLHDDNLRVADEENFTDLKTRAVRCLDFLERRGPHEICVVTHKIFLQLLLSYITVGKQLHAADYAKLSFFNPTDNASITICSYSPWRRYTKNRGWTIVSYNERPIKSFVRA